jgi:hypothetical protein
MVDSASSYIRLAHREGFNASVRHINRTLDLLEAVGPKTNIADEINRLIDEKAFDPEETQAAVNMLLVEKWKYSAVSKNLVSIPEKVSAIAEETSKWKAIDLVIGYHHPDIGFIIMNPKNPDSASIISGFRKNELVVLYAGTPSSDASVSKNAEAAIAALLDLFADKSVKVPASLANGSFAYNPPKKATPKVPKAKAARQAKAPGRPSVRAAASSAIYTGSSAAPAAETVVPVKAAAPAPAAVPGSSKMSPLVSVVVSNELFHNGNVEAWKRIIRSYNAKYPALQVFIYYDGERIVDINTLFKWGKVKHGSCIQFCVSGENIQDLAKLSRYFRQGASPQFEAFLHGSPDTVMNLF